MHTALLLTMASKAHIPNAVNCVYLTIPHVIPFHFSFPVTSANFQISAMAVTLQELAFIRTKTLTRSPFQDTGNVNDPSGKRQRVCWLHPYDQSPSLLRLQTHHSNDSDLRCLFLPFHQ